MNGLGGIAQGPGRIQHLVMVCERCKTGKKKCDKRMPSCSRCERLQVTCRYSPSQAGPPRPHAVSSHPELGLRNDQVSSSTECLVELAGLYPFNGHPRGHIPSRPLDYFRDQGNESGSLDDMISRNVRAILHQGRHNAEQICARYVASVHKWFPVLDDVDILSQRLMADIDVDADSWMLLLSLNLVVTMYEDGIQIDGTQVMNRLYLATKSLLSVVSAYRQPTAEHIQSGLLIGLYEHCQALYEAAYLTIGSCARIGYLLGYDRSRSHVPSVNLNGTIHKGRRVWWCIIILERLIKIQNLDSGAPFAIQTPSLMDLLPSTSGTVYPVVTGLSFSDTVQPDLLRVRDENGKMVFDLFSLIAQATYLLCRALDIITAARNGQQADSQAKSALLDHTIQSFAMALLRTKDVLIQCWPYDICMSALMILNRHEVSLEKVPNHVQISGQRSRASQALHSVTKMTIESLAAHPEALEKHINSVPIWTVQTAFLASIVEVEYFTLWDSEDTSRRKSMLNELHRVLLMFKSRSRLAGE